MLIRELPMAIYRPIDTEQQAVLDLQWAHSSCLGELLKLLTGPIMAGKKAADGYV